MTSTTNAFRKIYDLPEFKDPYEHDLAKFPYILDIEITNYCNLDCIMCGRQIMERAVGFMDFELFKQVIDEASTEGALGIRLIRYGEPYAHTKVFDMIKYAKSKGLVVHTTTNGLLLDEEKIRKILDSGLDSIIFSFQGTTKEEYEKMRNNNKYDLLVKNIQTLAEERKKRNLDKPHIQVNTTVLDETEEQIKEFEDRWKNIADYVDHWKTSLLRIAHVKRVRPLLERQRIGKVIKKHAENWKCPEVMTKLSINWDGKVTACCEDFDEKLIIGKFPEKSLKELWTSENEQRIREILENKDYSKLNFCKTCISDF